MPCDHDVLTDLDAPDAVKTWLGAFVAATGPGEGAGLDDLFADPFVSGDPTGSMPVPRAAFVQALPAREQMFRTAGWADPALESAQYVALGNHFGALSTTWRMSALDGSDASVRLRSSFVLRQDGGRAEVIAYLNDQDLRALLRIGEA
jgi:hypothetical protein